MGCLAWIQVSVGRAKLYGTWRRQSRPVRHALVTDQGVHFADEIASCRRAFRIQSGHLRLMANGQVLEQKRAQTSM